jgi:hypothetical protein
MGRSPRVLRVSVCSPVYALLYLIVMGRCPCVLHVSVCGPVYALVYLIVMGRCPGVLLVCCNDLENVKKDMNQHKGSTADSNTQQF